jgi:hypothetical protein
MCGWTLVSLAASPARATILAKPAVVIGAPNVRFGGKADVVKCPLTRSGSMRHM